MTTSKRQRTVIVKQESDDSKPPTVEVTTRLIKWLSGIVGAIAVIVVAFWQLGNWLDNHWMLATIANQREEKHDAAIKALAEKNAGDYKVLSDKYDAQLLKLALDASRGRAWLIFSVADLKTLVLEGRADDCKEKKQKDCAKAIEAHMRAQGEADKLKQSAMEVSK